MELSITKGFCSLRKFYEKIIALNKALISDYNKVDIKITNNKHILSFRYSFKNIEDVPITITIDFNEPSITVTIYFLDNEYDDRIKNLVSYLVSVLST